jgi:hypothetical protein
LVRDEGYLLGDSHDLVDRTNSGKLFGAQRPITEEQASQILARLEASQANKEYTQSTADWMDAEYRFNDASEETRGLEQANIIERWSKLPQARERLKETFLKRMNLEAEMKKKLKKKGEEDTSADVSTR